METKKYKFNKEADEYLDNLYKSFGSTTTEQKINLLELKLGGASNFYAMGHKVTDDMKLAAYEYEILDCYGLIELTLA